MGASPGVGGISRDLPLRVGDPHKGVGGISRGFRRALKTPPNRLETPSRALGTSPGVGDPLKGVGGISRGLGTSPRG